MGRKTGYLLLGVFLVLMVVGLVMGEFRTVLANAVMVCLSCIGIG